jgi:hypothetical protein
VIGVVTIFSGLLVHMSKLNLGTPRSDAPMKGECPWKLGAMVMVAVVIICLGFWLPAPLFQLIEAATKIVGGNP